MCHTGLGGNDDDDDTRVTSAGHTKNMGLLSGATILEVALLGNTYRTKSSSVLPTAVIKGIFFQRKIVSVSSAVVQT